MCNAFFHAKKHNQELEHSTSFFFCKHNTPVIELRCNIYTVYHTCIDVFNVALQHLQNWATILQNYITLHREKAISLLEQKGSGSGSKIKSCDIKLCDLKLFGSWVQSWPLCQRRRCRDGTAAGRATVSLAIRFLSSTVRAQRHIVPHCS